MATPAQIAANRRNALRSTGPRTAAGKAVSSRNALRHGLTSRAMVVLDEDAQDFQRLRAELWAGLAPRDAREEVLVETVVQAAWRMRRAWRAEARLFNRAGRLDPVFSQPRELLTVIRHEASANRAFHRALALLERGRSAAGAARASRRQGAQLEIIVYEKGTQFPDARLAAGTARASRRQAGRPETIIYEKGTQFPDARPARAESLGAPGVLAVRSEPVAFAETLENAREPSKNRVRTDGIGANSARGPPRMPLPRRPFLCNRPPAPP